MSKHVTSSSSSTSASGSTLGEAIRAARCRRGWSLDRLVKELWTSGYGVSQNKMWRIEQGQVVRGIEHDLLVRLERLLGISLSEDGHGRVAVADVLDLVDSVFKARSSRASVPVPEDPQLRTIHRRLAKWLEKQ